MKTLATALVGLIAYVAFLPEAKAVPWKFHGFRSGSVKVEYAYLPGKPDRTILVMPPGKQDRDYVKLGLERWVKAFQSAGVGVICPVAPGGVLYFKGSETHIPDLLDHAAKVHGTPAQGIPLVGMSNGGLSAFRVATLFPDRFTSLLVIPGYAKPEDRGRLKKIRTIPVTLVAGAFDKSWVKRARSTAAALRKAGGSAKVVIYPGSKHRVFRDVDPAKVLEWMGIK